MTIVGYTKWGCKTEPLAPLLDQVPFIGRQDKFVTGKLLLYSHLWRSM